MLREISAGATLVLTQDDFVKLLVGDFKQGAGSLVLVIPNEATHEQRIEYLKAVGLRPPSGAVPPGILI